MSQDIPVPFSSLDEATSIINKEILVADGNTLERITIENFAAYFQMFTKIAIPISPSDPAPTVAGWFKPRVYSAAPGTNYPNHGNLKAIKGYETLFYFSGTSWVDVVNENTEVSPEFDPNTETIAQGGLQISKYVDKRVKIQDTLFNTVLHEKSTKQLTAALPIANGGVGSVYGVSASIGVVLNPRTKVTIPFAQNPANPVTQIEIRLFQGKTVGGTPIITKRQSVSPGSVTQATATIDLGATVSYSGEAWVQILMDKPFAYKYNNTAPNRTAANGYGVITVSTTSNLDATSFPQGGQVVGDLYIEFNEVENVIVPTPTGGTVISGTVTENINRNITPELLAVNSYLDSTGQVVPSANWRTTQRGNVVGISSVNYTGTTTGSAVSMVGYKANNDAVLMLGTGTYNNVSVPIPSGVVEIAACGFYTGLPIVTVSETKIKSTLLPATLATGKIEINKTWNCVGHSIWWQDGGTYPDGSTCIGIQTLVKKIFKFSGYNKYCWSGFSLGAINDPSHPELSGVNDPYSLTNKFNSWTDASSGFWTIDTITNDFKREIPIGTIDNYNNNTGQLTYYGALRLFKDKVNSLTPGAPVICFNALKRNTPGFTSTSPNSLGHKILDYEKALMTVAALNGYRYVDQHRQSEITDETLDITTRDGLHLNNFGYTLAVKPVIKEFWILANEKS